MTTIINTPDLWLPQFPWPQPQGNKYDRGHAVVAAGAPFSTGASKLAATAALRVGAGLVSIACPLSSLPLYAPSLQAVMTKQVDTLRDWKTLLADKHITAVALGPGMGVKPHTKSYVLAELAAKKPLVLDADALTVFARDPGTLFKQLHAPAILTPHTGEFARLFPNFDAKANPEAAATEAARLSGAVVVLKGFHTHIAAPDGRVAKNNNATAFLATAGSGDVLTGLCLGLLAQGMPAFEAACAAVWLHAETGRRFGPGLIAEDIAPQLAPLLQELLPS